MLADFQGILNRQDCSDALARTYLNQGIRRIQREARWPSMERYITIETEGTEPSITSFMIPDDFLQPIDVFHLPGKEWGEQMKALPKKPYRTLLTISPQNSPSAYARFMNAMFIRGSCPDTDSLVMHYYAQFSAFASDDGENELSTSAPDLAVYAGLVYAGKRFQIDEANTWEGIYQEIKNEMDGLSIDTDAEGGPQEVQMAYGETD